MKRDELVPWTEQRPDDGEKINVTESWNHNWMNTKALTEGKRSGHPVVPPFHQIS